MRLQRYFNIMLTMFAVVSVLLLFGCGNTYDSYDLYREFERPHKTIKPYVTAEPISTEAALNNDDANDSAEERIYNYVPYVGMSESLINSTYLGVPRKLDMHRSRIINNKHCEGNIYLFENEEHATLFEVTCFENKVYSVWDYRDNPRPTYVPVTHSPERDAQKKIANTIRSLQCI